MSYIVIVGTTAGHGRPLPGEFDVARNALARAKAVSLTRPNKIVTVVTDRGYDIAYYRNGGEVYGNAVGRDQPRRRRRDDGKTVEERTMAEILHLVRDGETKKAERMARAVIQRIRRKKRSAS